MNEELISKMETDMRLFRFCNESQTKYAARVLYSGLAMWMKAISLDGFFENSKQISSVSKKHHTERSDFIMKQFLDFAPEVKTWFYNDNTLGNELSPIHIMQNRLLIGGELEELGFTNRITSVLPTKVKVSGDIVRCKGLYNGIQAQYNGITSVIEESPDVLSVELVVKALEFSDKYIRSLNLVQDTWSCEKEYFNPYIRTDTLYQSWVTKVPEQDIYISRIETGIQQYRYFVESRNNDITKSHKIDEHIIETGNLSRILMTLRYKANNPIAVKITHYPDHFELKRYVSSFPFPEEAILHAFGWPINDISDNLNFCFHSYLFPEIKNILERLLIKINEVTHE